MIVESLVLTGVGCVLQWRSDGSWRQVDVNQLADERSGRHVPTEDDWAAWTGLQDWQGRGARYDGRPGWFSAFGEVPPGAHVTVQLADGARPEVRHVGRLWGAQWFSVVQPVTVQVGAEVTTLAYRRPRSLMSPEG